MEQKKNKIPVMFLIMTYLFLLSISVSAIPTNTIGIYGFFGDLHSVFVQSESQHSKEAYLVEKYSFINKSSNLLKLPKILCVFNFTWILQVIIICFISYTAYSNSLPDSWNPITLKVRLND